MSKNQNPKSLLPTLFISHGSPMFALEPGMAGPKLEQLGQGLPRPAAIAVISPHWMTRGAAVCTVAKPQTIHDFGGFDPRLYQMQYPANGQVEYAQAAIECLAKAGYQPVATEQWGLDHGTWVPLKYLYPEADVPVFQISLPAGLNCQSAYAYGQALSPLREKNVLIIGSGSLTHNLRELNFNRLEDAPTAPYVKEFVNWVTQAVERNDTEALQHSEKNAPHYARAHPTDEHYLPLLIALGASNGQVGRTIEGGVTYGLISMDSFVFD